MAKVSSTQFSRAWEDIRKTIPTLCIAYYVRDRIKILRSEATGQWSIREKNADRSNVKANTTYGTKRMSAYHILEQTLNQRDVRVFDYIEDENGKKKPVLNKKETAIAQDRQELIKQKFAEWIWKDIDRRELLCRIYNETFNGVRPREYDGRHIRFEGMNPEISLRPHQINAIAHILYGGNTLLAHEVGAGKTYEMVAAAMEMKRLGLCTKSLIVVPNHITEQWAAEWLQLYPSANILVATKKDFETQNRKKFCSRIATGDYDAIIIGHSQFEKIPMSVERQQAILERQIEEILEGIEQAKAQKADLSTPTTDGSFSVYDDLKKKLMDAGIPEEEIAFIHTADSEAKKKELFSKVRAGQVRVLLGSTAKMGAGTNVQDKLIALHDLDCPWRPSDLQQRLGRIVRQGNENEEVEIYRYVTEGTFDAYLYQLVENKQKFIAQIMTSKAPVRVADDVDETALSYSEIKALATGNPLIIEKCNLDMEVARLNMLKASHLNQVYALEELVYRKYPEEITRLTERIAGYEQDVALAAAHPKAQEGFCGMEVDGKHYTEKEDAGKAIIDVCTRMTGSDAVLLGQYRGFSMVLAYDGRSNEYRITLKGTLSHTVTLGADVFGNITRLDNALENLAGSLQAEQNSLEETKAQLENARTELATPFAREEELAEKTARLKELNILLNMDEKDKTLLDDTPDEGEDVPARRVAELAR